MVARNWGGPRAAGPGKRLGRPPRATPLERVNVRLTREQIETLRAIGGGNLTAGIRRLLAEHER